MISNAIPLYLQIYSDLARACLESQESLSRTRRDERQLDIEQVRSLQQKSGSQLYAMGNMGLLFFGARAALQLSLTHFAPGREGLSQGCLLLLDGVQKQREGVQGGAKASIDTEIHLVMNRMQSQESGSGAKVEQLVTELLRLVGELYKPR